MNYLTVIERYHEYQETIQELLASILTGITGPESLCDEISQERAIRMIREHYPFVEMLYFLNDDGVQISANLRGKIESDNLGNGQGKDRSQRPYFQLAKLGNSVVVTQPYLSSENRHLCLSASVPITCNEGRSGYAVIDSNLTEVISFLMGDSFRKRFEPIFKFVYVCIVVGIFCVTGLLLYTAYTEAISLLQPGVEGGRSHLVPFSVIIFLTLALAMFDLGKTTLEEEVLMHKDIFRHSSTRRTITRFISAILVAVSIEALLMMFKVTIDGGHDTRPAVMMMFAAIGLLIGLGIYVFLGAKAEAILLTRNVRKYISSRE
jgi:hypothetical protein